MIIVAEMLKKNCILILLYFYFVYLVDSELSCIDNEFSFFAVIL